MTSLPASLVAFRGELEDAIGRDLRRTRRRRATFRAALVAATAATTALGIFSWLPGSEPPASARAASALRLDESTILHTRVETRLTTDGLVQTSSVEAWEHVGTAWAYREIRQETYTPGAGFEGGRLVGRTRIYRFERSDGPSGVEIYDSSTNTVYVHATPPAPFFRPGPRPGTAILNGSVWKCWAPIEVEDPRDCKGRWVPNTEVIPLAQARAMRADATREFAAAADVERARLLRVLARDDLRESGVVNAGGRQAIALKWRGGRSTYLVDANTYDPVELRERRGRETKVVRFLTYERLPLDRSTRGLLSVRAQHPTARVSRDRAEFEAAERRLLPHG